MPDISSFTVITVINHLKRFTTSPRFSGCEKKKMANTFYVNDDQTKMIDVQIY